MPAILAAPIALATGWHAGGLYTVGLLFLALVIVIGAAALSYERAVPASVLYVALGGLAAGALSVLDVQPLDPVNDYLLVERIAELALVVAVFSAGLTIERHVLRRSWISVAVLLVVVMPLTILAIAALGVWVMGLSFGAAFLLGSILAPTDPVLAGDVGLTAPGGDVLGEPRLSLHTEAGFNDGLASPFVVLGLFIATRSGSGWVGEWLLADLLYGAGFALVLGAAAGWAAAAAITRPEIAAVISERFKGVAVVALMLALYGATEALGAYGLLAVFAAGFTFRRYEFDHEIHHSAHAASEIAGKTLELLVLLMLGTMLTLSGLAVPGIGGYVLAATLILVVRPVLVLATAGRLMDTRGALFLGFFGVRGVAALFYAAIVVGSHSVSASEGRTIVWTTVVCVVISIVVHGLLAQPLTARLLMHDEPSSERHVR